MTAWKAHEKIDFDFCDCQLQSELNSDDEYYIKRRCRERINMAGTYVLLIGTDTRYKHKYVRWEAEVAIEKQCRLIGVNLDGWRTANHTTCPAVFRNVGAMFVPFSPQILAYAIENAVRNTSDDWHYKDEVYRKLGYRLVGDRAERIPVTPPWFAR
jgi:hypothetical protein